MSDEITPDMFKAWLEANGHIQVRKGDEADSLLQALEGEFENGTALGATIDYHAQDWVVIFRKDFYEQYCNDSASLNPLLRKAIEKVKEDLTFRKTISGTDKPAIMLPGIDRPVGEFAIEIAEYYAAKQTLFYRPETSEVARIGMVKVDDAEHMILGLQPVNENAFVTYLEQDINLYALDGRGERHIRSVPAQTAKLVLASVDQFKMKLPIVKRLLPVPVPRLIEGKLRFPRKGYDPSFMSFVPEDAPEIKEMPIEDAKELLLNEVYGEFAFKSPQDKVNALAHLITPLCRGLFSRETTRSPLFIYLANREGSGKDYAAGIVSIVYQGEAAEDPPVTKAESGSDDEFRKKVVASFKIGRNLIHSSNNKGFLNSPELESLVTKEVYVDRQLGSNTLLEFPNTLTISLSANTGLTYPADLQRRAIFVNLFLDLEDPNARVFANPDLHGWTREHRSDVLSALYALVRNWVDRGMPKSKQPFASFPEWQAVVGGILETAGIGTPLQNDTLNAIGGDEETNSMRQLYAAAYEAWGSEWVPKAKIFEELQNADGPFFGLFGYLDWGRRPESAKMRMGKLLGKYAARIFADIRMEEFKPGGHHSNLAKYRFIKIGDNVPSQSALQNNEIENSNKSDVKGTSGTSGTFPLDKNTESSNNIYNIAIETTPPMSPISPSVAQTPPNSNTLLATSNQTPTSQNNGTSQPNALSTSVSPTEGQAAGFASLPAPGENAPTTSPSLQSPGQAGVPSPTPAPGPDPKIQIIHQVLAAVKEAQNLNIAINPDDPDPRLYGALSGLYPDQIKFALKELEHSGDIYSPRPGYWRVVRTDDVDVDG